MITGIPLSRAFKWSYRAYVTLFFIYLALPLATVCAFAFNDSVFPSLPWEGFTWAWFFGTDAPYIGVFHERPNLTVVNYVRRGGILGVLAGSFGWDLQRVPFRAARVSR